MNCRRPATVPDAVIVLGAKLIVPGTPTATLRRRVRHGVRVVEATGARHLLVSGGMVGPPPPEAHVMRDLAVAEGLPADRILIEDAARNTFENAVYTGLMIRERRWQRVIIVTDSFHLPRALYVFRRIGLRVEGAAVRRPPDYPLRAWMRLWLRDIGAFVQSAWLFHKGVHKPVIARVWHRGEEAQEWAEGT